MAICQEISMQSCGCPITGIQFEPFVTGQLQLDTHVIRMSTASDLMDFFASSELMKCATYIFAQKKFSKDIFSSEICLRYD